MKRLLVLTTFLFIWCAPSRAAITEVTAAECVANAITCTPGTVQRGDMGLAFAYRSGSATAPSASTGWTTTATACGGANTNACRVACTVASSTSFSNVPSFANATQIIVLVFRGANTDITANCGTTALGGMLQGGASSNAIAYNGITLQAKVDGTSWVVGCAGHNTATNVNTAPAGMTNVQATGTGPMAACHDTQGGVNTWTTQSVTVNTSSGWRSFVVEVKARAAIPAAVVDRWGGVSTQGNAVSAYQGAKNNPLLAGNALIVATYWNDTASVVGSVSDENSDTFTKVVQLDSNSATVTLWCAMATTGTQKPKLTFSGGVGTTTFVSMTSVIEVKGITNCTNDGTSSAGSIFSGALASGSITTTAANDVIVQMAVDVGVACPTSWSAGPSPMTLMLVDRNPGGVGPCSATQLEIQPAAAALVPTMFESTVNTGITVAAAFKTSATGTAPTVTPRIVAQQSSYDSTGNGPFTTQLPGVNGDMFFAGTLNAPTCTWPSVSDNRGNTWTQRGSAFQFNTSGILQSFDSIAAVADSGFAMTSGACSNTGGGASNHQVVEVTGSGSFDNRQTASGTQTGAGGDFNGPTVTPAHANGIIIWQEANNSNDIISITSNGVFQCGVPTPFAGTNDPACDNNGFGTFNNTGTSPVTVVWHSDNPVSGWASTGTAYDNAVLTGVPNQFPRIVQ